MSAKSSRSCLDSLAYTSLLRRTARSQCLKRASDAGPLHTAHHFATSSRRLRSSQLSQAKEVSKAGAQSGSVPPQGTRPRWSYTPDRMVAPFTLKDRKPENAWAVNESQEKLDAYYKRLLGEGGDKLLTDEVKWLAITHKSFDQGRRGYNDRLAFLGKNLIASAAICLCLQRLTGKRIMNLQTSLYLLNRTDGVFLDPPDDYKREPFRHPGVDLLSRLNEESKHSLTHRPRIATFAQNSGLLSVLRWRPRHVSMAPKLHYCHTPELTIY